MIAWSAGKGPRARNAMPSPWWTTRTFVTLHIVPCTRMTDSPRMKRFIGVVALVVLAACPGPQQTGGGGGGGGGGRGGAISPDSCGKINTTTVGRKAYAFLVAS